LRKIGPAPGFTLTSQDGTRLSLGDLQGKVIARRTDWRFLNELEKELKA
jgi:hypothetical protein